MCPLCNLTWKAAPECCGFQGSLAQLVAAGRHCVCPASLNIVIVGAHTRRTTLQTCVVPLTGCMACSEPEPELSP